MTVTTPRRAAQLSVAQMRAAIPKLERRIYELRDIDLSKIKNELASSTFSQYLTKINATIRAIYGADTIEYKEHSVDSLAPIYIWLRDNSDIHDPQNRADIHAKITGIANKLAAVVSFLHEQIEDADEEADSRTLKAYEGLDLHPEIANRASKLFQDGHYATAVEHAVKALNALVRLRSGEETDGANLMEKVFSPKTPVLKFNALANQSEIDEQKGYQQMFAGAVSGLRNPRAHQFMVDKPERALEFIAFVSLLAKLLDEAKN